MSVCPNCGEGLSSHAGRGGLYFHKHVLDGPYPNPAPHHCKLVDYAFEEDGKIIKDSAKLRYLLVEAIHGKSFPTKVIDE